ncbi:aromatic aminobenezylarsenical efflux permease ArsG family transporter [uncultured Parabacteroides sp.]|uniref:aromatic aminobenezylarsenical efflux permease ArsG family transporter n=1 Tax=uncultured Parabacteroides sp. TaxID=512312 RepID=UPI00262A666D|nr:aromatic aminobenezylarsenical efflux permease ArsG family transporter [uncultured Parabacteroides sp.]
MEQFLSSLIESSNLPILTAFLLGILTSVSPCTFTTNVMVLGYIGKDMNGGHRIFANGLFYTLGRIVSYTTLGLLCIPILKKGASTFFIQSVISEYGGYILAPTLVAYGLFLLFGNKLPIGKFGFKATERSKRLHGGLGAFVLGLLFALAFCPVSGVFYFGMLLPMAALEPGGYLFPAIFAVASGILVVLIAWIVAFGMSSLGRFYNRVNLFQKWLNLIVGIAFISAGIYYFCIYHIQIS